MVLPETKKAKDDDLRNHIEGLSCHKETRGESRQQGCFGHNLRRRGDRGWDVFAPEALKRTGQRGSYLAPNRFLTVDGARYASLAWHCVSWCTQLRVVKWKGRAGTKVSEISCKLVLSTCKDIDFVGEQL